MPGVEGQEPTPQELATVRKRAYEKLEEAGLDNFYPRDLKRLETDDHYVTRFWLHVYDMPRDQEDEAIDMIVNTFKWRKEFGAEDVSVSEFTQVMFERGALYAHNRDRDGSKLLVFAVGKHVKGIEKMILLKRFFVYYLERLEREESGREITIVFDCTGAGIKNMDMEFIQFIIGVFKDYYPNMLNYILVFEMPWVLNAAWKVIKAWLPAAAVKKIKFLTKTNMTEYVDDDNRLEAWGGNDDWEYKWEPESEQPLQNGHGPDAAGDATKKKSVTFAEGGSSSHDSIVSLNGPTGSPPRSGESLLRIVPPEEIVFNGTGDLSGKIQITNVSGRPAAYKIKTTSPEKYKVRPPTGILAAGASAVIEIHVTANHVVHAASLVKDKFLITAIVVESEDLSASQLQDALRQSRPAGQHRLRCVLAPDHPLFASVRASAAVSVAPEDPLKQLSNLVKKVNQLNEKSDRLEGDVKLMSRIQIGLLLLVLLLVFMLYWGSQPIECPQFTEELGKESVGIPAPPVKADL